MATRRISSPQGEARLDFGAQYFTVREAEFSQWVESQAESWGLRAWKEEFFSMDRDEPQKPTRRWIHPDGLNAWAKQLAHGLSLKTEWRLESVSFSKAQWELLSTTGQMERAKNLVMTCPLPQNLEILRNSNLELKGLPSVDQNFYESCIALLVVLKARSQTPDAGFWPSKDSAFSWVADNQKKQISSIAALTLHFKPELSRELWDRSEAEILDRARPEIETWGEIETYQVHRWRYSQPLDRTPKDLLAWRNPGNLVLAGDYFSGGRVEGAALSGLKAARTMIEWTS
jgi:predicted NAD/FAD-dependent oxidoreductase